MINKLSILLLIRTLFSSSDTAGKQIPFLLIVYYHLKGDEMLIGLFS